ncbi:hypothetical protein BPJM79_50183 [Bacillus pumilus]
MNKKSVDLASKEFVKTSHEKKMNASKSSATSICSPISYI